MDDGVMQTKKMWLQELLHGLQMLQRLQVLSMLQRLKDGFEPFEEVDQTEERVLFRNLWTVCLVGRTTMVP